MANTEKQLALIQQLLGRTKDGSLRWERTTQRGTYMVAFPDYAIRISGESHDVRTAYSLRVYDAAGNITVEIGGNRMATHVYPDELDYEEVRGPLAELYEAASQVGDHEADRAIDAVLAELKRLQPAERKAS
jgi:hypothetical protein